MVPREPHQGSDRWARELPGQPGGNLAFEEHHYYRHRNRNADAHADEHYEQNANIHGNANYPANANYRQNANHYQKDVNYEQNDAEDWGGWHGDEGYHSNYAEWNNEWTEEAWNDAWNKHWDEHPQAGAHDALLDVCLNCGSPEHAFWGCPLPKLCGRFGEVGHKPNACPYRNYGRSPCKELGHLAKTCFHQRTIRPVTQRTRAEH